MNLTIKTISFVGLAGLIAACGGGGGGSDSAPSIPTTPSDPPAETPSEPTVAAPAMPTLVASPQYNDIGVHDPSVVADGEGNYYVIGSHLAMARTADFVTWELVANEVNDNNPLFNTYATEIAEGLDYVGGHAGSWASDIIQFNDGSWHFYFDHCATADDGLCDFPRSYLGVARADDIEGPYENQGIFLWSGQTDAEIANGFGVGDITSFDPTIHPNVIDPDAFYDKDGKLWMVYGSYSGGIFILAMDETTGMPLPDQGFGKHLAGGDHSAIEGPYIFHSPESDYYYLFTSFGGFAANDGYNIRISRSRNPDGPYLDAAGNDMTLARGNWNGIASYGVKLMGGFEFTTLPGDPSMGYGYMAPGHNSAYYDADTGRHLLITHTRFPNRGEAHAIRVHELFLNSDDWLVASPQRYAQLDGDNIVGSDDAVGNYRFVDHGKDINTQPHQSATLRLNEDGSVTGAREGSFEVDPETGRDIMLTLDGTDYQGVIMWQWDAAAESLTPVFSALSAEGASIWGSQLEARSDAEVLEAIAAAIDLPSEFSGASLDLPLQGSQGASIQWQSSDSSVISPSGQVTRPAPGAGNQTVTLSAEMQLGDNTHTAYYDIEVAQRADFNRVAYWPFDGDLEDALGNFPAARTTGERIWDVGNGAPMFTPGQTQQAVALDGSGGIRLPEGLINNYEYSVSFWINPQMHTQFSTAFFAAINEQQEDADPFSNQWLSLVPQGWDGNTMLWSGSDPWFDGLTGTLIPENTWTHVGFSVDQGLVRVFINGEERFSGANLSDFFSANTGVFGLGVNYWDLPLNAMIDELKIYDAALQAEEMYALDVAQSSTDDLLDIAVDLIDLGDLTSVKEDLTLPGSGAFGAVVTWKSSDSNSIAIDGSTGRVTRPAEGSAGVEATLTATVTLGGQSAQREFPVTIAGLGLPQAVAHFGFEDNLDDTRGQFNAGMATGATISAAGGNPMYSAGIAGQALQLDGNTGVALDSGLVDGSVYSFSLWLNPDALSAYTTALFGGPNCDVGAEGCDSWVSVVPGGLSPTGSTMLWSGTAWFDALTDMRIPTGQWSHFAAVHNNGTLRVYINGEERFNGSNFPDVFSGQSGARFWIGVNHWDPAYQGRIDELKFYREALTASEVNSLFEQERN